MPVCALIFFTLYFNVFYRAQIGLRFFVVVFPLLHSTLVYRVTPSELERLGLVKRPGARSP